MSEENKEQGQQGQTEQQTFSKDYVSSIREEAKNYRLTAKQYESSLKEVLGLDAKADISDLGNLIKGFKDTQSKAINDTLAVANNRLISAELKGLTDYNSKLVEKLLDKSKITVEANGEVKGINEQLAELEKEFPEIKKQAQGTQKAGFNPAGASKEDTWEDKLKEFILR